MYGKDIIEEAIKIKSKELLRKSEGFVGNVHIELEFFYDKVWKPEPYILLASKDHGVVTGEKYATEEEAEADYISLKNKYNLEVST